MGFGGIFAFLGRFYVLLPGGEEDNTVLVPAEEEHENAWNPYHTTVLDVFLSSSAWWEKDRKTVLLLGPGEGDIKSSPLWGGGGT